MNSTKDKPPHTLVIDIMNNNKDSNHHANHFNASTKTITTTNTAHEQIIQSTLDTSPHTKEDPLIKITNVTYFDYTDQKLMSETQGETVAYILNQDTTPQSHTPNHNNTASNDQTSTKETNNPYRCEICDKNFALKKYLARHNNIHKKNPPFKCPKCNKVCRDNTSLKQHDLIHSRDKPFKCHFCDHKFAYLTIMKEHIQLHHKRKKTYPCDVCQKEFKLPRYMMRHRRLSHRKCDMCNKYYMTNNDLINHIKENH